jgi:hypothetical protein
MCTIARTRVPRGREEKKIKQLRNTCTITHTCIPRGKEEKKKKTNKKHMYNCSYTCSEGKRRKKKRKQIRNMCTIIHTRVFKANKKKYIKNTRTIAHTHVSGPGVLEKVDGCWKHVAGSGKTWLDGQKAWLGAQTRSWGLANVHNRANKWKKM